MILFLDFDGVLHSEPCYDQTKLFCFLPRLEKVLRDYPQIDVVISSTWRESRTLHELQGFFSADIAPRVVGVTPSWRDYPDLFEVNGFQRHTEILAWIRYSSEPWVKWVAVDDKAFLFKPFLKNLVRTSSLTGFDATAENQLRSLINEI
jgi:hypothetical protein